MADTQVSIYTTPTCSYCKQAKEYFKEHNIDFNEYDVASDVEKRQEMIQRTGQLGVPVIAVDDQMVIGFDPDKIGELLSIS